VKPIHRCMRIRTILLLVGMSAVAGPATAWGQPEVKYGIKLGPSIGRQTYESEVFGGFNAFDHPLTGLDAGLFLKFPRPRFFIQGELHFVQKGSADEYEATDSIGNVIGIERLEFRIDYLTMSISAGREIRKGMFAFYIFTGPRLDIWTGSGSEWFEMSFEVSKRFILGSDIGTGVRCSLGRNLGLLLEIRYAYDWTYAYSESSVTLRNSALQILMGLELD
jgi:hypothetical protein